MKQTMIIIPKGMLSADDAVAEEHRKLREALLRGDGKTITIHEHILSAENAAAARRKLREWLLSGNEVIVTESGESKLSSEVKPSGGDFIEVPKGMF